MSKKSNVNNRSGWLLKQDGTAAFARTFVVLKGRDLSFFASDARDEKPYASLNVEDAVVGVADISRVSKRHAMEVVTAASSGLPHGAAAAGAGAGSSGGARPSQRIVLAADSSAEQEAWLQSLSVAAVSDGWPGGVDANKRPMPLLYSLWAVGHVHPKSSLVPAAAAASSAGNGTGRPSSLTPAGGSSAAILPRLPAVKGAPAWQRKALLLRKLRLCTVTFDGTPATRALEEREVKRNTLLEIVDYVDDANSGSGMAGAGAAALACAPRAVLGDMRFLEDLFAMLRCNLFRSLPEAPPPSGDPDEEEEAFTDPQWPHLNIAYELLLRMVTSETLELSAKKKLIDAGFVRQLMGLFDSEDARERDYLKTIAHRIYSKLTQRRALIRRVICNVFFDFVLETERHNGIAEMLEILASIINGFAVPIKEEHRIMLTRALLPLHKSRALAGFHPQLSYCMALYVSKEHTLTRDVLSGLLRYWPLGSTQKQLMLLNELEDLFEYVQEDDVPAFRAALAKRLASCIGGFHFQVAERTLLLWNNERISALLLEHAEHRAAVLPTLFPALWANTDLHWHEAIRTLSSHLLARYEEVDPTLVQQCREEVEAQQQLAAEEAAAAAAAAAGRGLAPGSPAPAFAGAFSPSGAGRRSLTGAGAAGGSALDSLSAGMSSLAVGAASSPAAGGGSAPPLDGAGGVAASPAAGLRRADGAFAATPGAGGAASAPATPASASGAPVWMSAGKARTSSTPLAQATAVGLRAVAGGAQGMVGAGASPGLGMRQFALTAAGGAAGGGGVGGFGSPPGGAGGGGAFGGVAPPLSPGGSGGHAGGVAHRAPVLRASQGFGVLKDADLLPGHRDPAVALSAQPRSALKDRMHLPPPMAMEGAGDGGDD